MRPPGVAELTFVQRGRKRLGRLQLSSVW